MVFIEFFADKIPGLDSLWDMVHTVIRIPAGAALAASVFGADHAVMAIVAALLGGSFAATAHVAKATTRAAINTSPEPFSNVGASLIEDGLVPAGLWLAVAHPLAFALLFAVLLVLSVWLIRKSWRFLRALFGRLTRIFSGRPDPGVVPVPECQAACRDGAQKTLSSAVASAKARNDAARRRAAMAQSSGQNG